jgi:hypothetical protein
MVREESRLWFHLQLLSHLDCSSFPFDTLLEGLQTFEIGYSMMECVPDCVILDVKQSLK